VTLAIPSQQIYQTVLHYIDQSQKWVAVSGQGCSLRTGLQFVGRTSVRIKKKILMYKFGNFGIFLKLELWNFGNF
jgi:hypothetical protein